VGLDFIFVPPEKAERDKLLQGDILRKDNRLKEALRHAHPYYADAEDYSHFMVLTQSCDLAKHGNRKPKSRYIALAAARPLHLVVDRLVEKHRFPDFEFPFPICSKDREQIVSQVLERLLHNTEMGYFFLRKGSHPNLAEDLCVFLNLSVALRIDHYDDCLQAKVAQLENVFQAKVGWLTGNLYSRVGTPDLEDHADDPDRFKQDFYEEVLYHRTFWLTPAQLGKLKNIVKAWKDKNGNQKITEEIARELIDNVPETIDIIAERAITRLASEALLAEGDDTKKRATNVLRNDNKLKGMIKSALVSRT